MRSTNKFICIGRLGQDIELRYMPNGDAVANFSLALSDDYKGKDGNKVDQTYWPRFTAYGKQAELLAEFVKKGDKLFIDAKFSSRRYTDKQGVEKEITEFKISEFELLGVRTSAAPAADYRGHAGSNQPNPTYEQQARQRAPGGGAAPTADDFNDNEIPF